MNEETFKEIYKGPQAREWLQHTGASYISDNWKKTSLEYHAYAEDSKDGKPVRIEYEKFALRYQEAIIEFDANEIMEAQFEGIRKGTEFSFSVKSFRIYIVLSSGCFMFESSGSWPIKRGLIWINFPIKGKTVPWHGGINRLP